MSKEKCENCRFWDVELLEGRKKVHELYEEFNLMHMVNQLDLLQNYPLDSSKCKRFPEKKEKGKKDWCGEFKPKEKDGQSRN